MFTLGPYTIHTPLLLAPMTGVSDAAHREICSAQGAGLTVGEMLSCNSELWGSDKNRLRQEKPDVPGPQMVQIAGSEPAMMAEAARLNVMQGADIIDINMGCPAKKVLRKAAGSALLRDIPRVESILRAVIAAVDVPVTLKIRTGWCTETRNGVEVAQLAEYLGVAMLTVHGRTRQDRFMGSAEYDTIAQIKKAVSIPVIANGDITSAEKARFVLDYTGADGLMIGRAAQGRPWVFKEIDFYLKQGRAMPTISLDEIRQVIWSHLQKIYQLYGDRKGVQFARKHISWYMKNLAQQHPDSIPDPAEFWRKFSQFDNPVEQQQALRSFLQRLSSEPMAAAA